MPQPGCHRCPHTVRLTPEDVALLMELLARFCREREQAGTTGGPCYGQATRLHAALQALQKKE